MIRMRSHHLSMSSFTLTTYLARLNQSIWTVLIGNWRLTITLLLVVTTIAGLAVAQRGRGYRWDRGRSIKLPWEVDRDVPKDVFTFVRVEYSSGGGYGRRGGGCWTDYPDSDSNFSLRLHQLTSLQVNPKPIVLSLTDPALLDYPFIYIVEPGRLYFYDEEVVALRNYLNKGGFLMVDDFWGEREWQNFRRQIRRVFPNREPEEVPLSHKIFHCVYDLDEKPQVPSIDVAWGGRSRGITWEWRPESDTSTPHYKAIKDDDGRIMVFICHNTDLGDGWEREGEQEWYFKEFSVKKAYPMGINIVTYAMTH